MFDVQLHVYDFDGTLFRSPLPPNGWDIKKDWWSDSQSLGDPCVADNPGSSMWVAHLVAQAKQSIIDQDVWAVLCTGRSLRSFARWRVPELLKSVGVSFDEVLLNTSTGNTPQFKAASVWKLLNKYPYIETVHAWDDDVTNLRAMETSVKRAERIYLPHHVPKAESPCQVNTGKVAGIIEAPPKLVKEITKWAFHVTAENRIQEIEDTLAHVRKNFGFPGEPSPGELRAKSLEQEQTFLRKYVSSKYTGWSPETQHFRVSDYLTGWKYAGVVANPDLLYRNQLKSAERDYAEKLKQYKSLGKYANPREEVELQGEVSRLQSRLEYLRKSGVSDFREYTDQRTIEVQLVSYNYRSHSTGWVGSWNQDEKILRVVLPMSLFTPRDRNQLETTIEHECRHFAQSYLQDALGVSEAGLPPKRIRTPQYHQDTPHPELGGKLNLGEDHNLDDHEFFTDLGNEVRAFGLQLAQNKVPKKVWDDALDVFTSVTDREPGHPAVHPSVFFYNIKNNEEARGKYIRAVKEIRKVFKYKGNAKVANQRPKMLSPEIRVATRWATRIARLPTPESKAWEKDLKAREKHVKEAMSAFKGLLKALQPYADQAAAAHSGKSADELSRRGRAFVKVIKELPEVVSYLDTWLGGDSAAYSWRNQVVYQARDTLLFKKALHDALVEIGKQADKGFESLALAESQSAVRNVIPEELRAFLPQKIVVDVDPDGMIKRVTDRFEAEYETLGIKVKTQHTLLNKYNAIAKQVKKDMRAGDELNRMAALITAILMETEIRPGKEGNKVVQMQDGKEGDVETFGAITLGPTHVNFIKDSFVKLEFVGKKGSTNIATLTDPEIIKLLKVYVEQAKKGGSSYIFVTAAGQTFTYTDLQRYFRKHFAEFSPTDFRKLKATETVLSFLREEQKSLYVRIRDFVTGKKSDLKQQVVQEVVSSIQRAYEHAQTALSHEDVATTIRAYVNPEVLLRFLSQGGIEETLSDALLRGKTSLSFDPDVFVAQSLKTSAAGKMTLLDLLEALEENLGGAVPRTAAFRVIEAAGTEADITGNIGVYKGALEDYKKAWMDGRLKGLSPDHIVIRSWANKPWVKLIVSGQLISNGILSTRSIPPKFVKAFELAYRFFNRNQSMPKDVGKWWETNKKHLNLLLLAVNWEPKEEGGDQKFKLGPFTVYNTTGASGVELESFKKTLEAVIKMSSRNPVPGFNRVLYGDVYYVGQLAAAHHAAWYNIAEDVLYVRPHKEKWGMEEAQTIIHELGHRYWKKFASREAKSQWYSRHLDVKSTKVDLKMPDIGDPLPLRVPGAPRGWRAIVDHVQGNYYWFKKPNGDLGSVDRFSIRKVVDHNEGNVKKFPTAYSEKSEEEHFCEALKLMAAGVLPNEHAIPFKAIWG